MAGRTKPNGRDFLAPAAIGTETTLACPDCGVIQVVGEGAGRLAGRRVLRCGRLGCRHQEPLPAATEVALAGGAPLPGLGEGETSVVNIAQVSAADAEKGGKGSRSARNGDGAARPRTSRTARLMQAAEAPIATPLTVTADAGDVVRNAAYGRPAMLPGGPPAARSRDAVLPLTLPTGSLHPSPLNPRQRFEASALAELVDSLHEVGMLQPIIVRPIGDVMDVEAGFWIVAGERRWRAAVTAGLDDVPVRIVEGLDDAGHLRLALTENEARRDLDPIEQARAYKRLADLTGQTSKEIGQAIGCGESTIRNQVRLLELPDDVGTAISEGRLSASHGRALLRFKAFPGVLRTIAGAAIDTGTSSKSLETGLPHAEVLRGARLVREIPYHAAGFDTSICQTCPFEAHVKEGVRDWCLKPIHMRELKREAEQRRSDARAAVASQTTAVDATPAGESCPPATIPKLADLAYGSYVNLSGVQKPTGCSGCPCKVFAEKPDGGTVAICVKPSQFAWHQEEDRRALREDLHRRHDAALELARPVFAQARLESGPTASPALVMVALEVLMGLDYGQVSAASEAASEWAPGLALPGGPPNSWRYSTNVAVRLARQLAELSTEAVTGLTLEVIGRRVLASQFGVFGNGDDLARWWLPEAAALRDGPAPAASDDDQAASDGED